MRLLIFGLLFVASAFPQRLDLIIHGGRLVDGTGNPWRMADVGVRGGRIVEIGNLNGKAAAKKINANGLIVAPGFIDIHNHSDNTILVDGNAESMVRQGVTSMIFGEGGSAAPLGGKQDVKNPRWSDLNGYFDL